MRTYVNFFPESYTILLLKMAGLLTCVLASTFPSHSKDSGFEEMLNVLPLQGLTKLTVAGTVPDLHRIPF